MHAKQASHTRTNQCARTTNHGNPRRDTRHGTHQARDSTGNTNQPRHQIRPTTRLSIKRRHIIIRPIRTLIRDSGTNRRLTRQLIISQHCMLNHKQSSQSVKNTTIVKPLLELLHGHTRSRPNHTVTRKTVHLHKEPANELRTGITRPIRNTETMRHPLHPITTGGTHLQTSDILILNTPNLPGHDTIHGSTGNLLSPTHSQRPPRPIHFKLRNRLRSRLDRQRIRRSQQPTRQTIQTIQIIRTRTLRVITIPVTNQRQITILRTQITNQLRDRQIIPIRLTRITLDTNTHIITLGTDAYAIPGMPRTIIRIHDTGDTPGLNHVMRGSTTRRTTQGINHTLERRMRIRITPPVNHNILDPIRAAARIIRTIILRNIFIRHFVSFQTIKTYQTVKRKQAKAGIPVTSRKPATTMTPIRNDDKSINTISSIASRLIPPEYQTHLR